MSSALGILLDLMDPSIIVLGQADERVFFLITVGLFALFFGFVSRLFFPSKILAAMSFGVVIMVGLVTRGSDYTIVSVVMLILGAVLRIAGGYLLAGAFRQRIRLGLFTILTAILFAFMYAAYGSTLGSEFRTFVKLLVIAMFLARLHAQVVSIRDRHPGSAASAVGIAVFVIMASIVDWESMIQASSPPLDDHLLFLSRNSFLAGILIGGCAITLKALSRLREAQ